MSTVFLWSALLLLPLQPVLDLPPDAATEPADPQRPTADDAPAASAPLLPIPPGLGLSRALSDHELLRGLQDARMRAGRTIVGGYGQINGSASSVGPGPDGEMLNTPVYSATLRRLVLFVSHSFSSDLRVYSELEWEHAIACRTCVGTAEIEQAFVEWSLWKTRDRDLLALRGGLLLVPIGVLNQWHEPPVFHGVERARMEEGAIIPSTWRELGVGITGSPLPGLRYEAYLTTGLDPLRLRDSGLALARGNGGLVAAQSLQLQARVEVEPMLGFLVGVAGVAGDMGGSLLGARPFYDASLKPLPLWVPLLAAEADARVRKHGVEARTVFVAMFMPAAGDLMKARAADGSLLYSVQAGHTGALPTRMIGASLELAYDVLGPLAALGGFETEQQLLPFARLERYDGQNDVPTGYLRDGFFDVRELTVGLSYRPIQQLVLKLDAQVRNRRSGNDEAQANVGLGFMF